MSQTMREALQAAANYIDTLGGDSKRYRCVLASSEQAQQGAERLMDELEAALREDGYEFAHQGPAVCAWIEGLGASRPAATAPAGGVTALREALQFYANGDHFVKHDPDVWDTVSGEPANLWEDEANSATVEDGSIARTALTAAARAAEPDPLQGAADWLKQAIVNCTATDIAGRLLVGHNRASRLFAASQTPPTGTSQGEGTS